MQTKGVLAQSAPFFVTVEHEDGDDGNDLRNGFVLAITFRRQDDIFGSSEQTQPRGIRPRPICNQAPSGLRGGGFLDQLDAAVLGAAFGCGIIRHRFSQAVAFCGEPVLMPAAENKMSAMVS